MEIKRRVFKMKFKKDDITLRLEKVKKEYKKWKKEQKKKIELNLPVEYQHYEDMDIEKKEDDLNKWCLFFPIILVILSILILIFTMGKL